MAAADYHSLGPPCDAAVVAGWPFQPRDNGGPLSSLKKKKQIRRATYRTHCRCSQKSCFPEPEKEASDDDLADFGTAEDTLPLSCLHKVGLSDTGRRKARHGRKERQRRRRRRRRRRERNERSPTLRRLDKLTLYKDAHIIVCVSLGNRAVF